MDLQKRAMVEALRLLDEDRGYYIFSEQRVYAIEKYRELLCQWYMALKRDEERVKQMFIVAKIKTSQANQMFAAAKIKTSQANDLFMETVFADKMLKKMIREDHCFHICDYKDGTENEDIEGRKQTEDFEKAMFEKTLQLRNSVEKGGIPTFFSKNLKTLCSYYEVSIHQSPGLAINEILRGCGIHCNFPPSR